MPASSLKWTDLDPKGAPGVKIADLWGDHAKGAFGAFVKLPAGFAVPLHTHTHAMKVVFLSGTYVQAPEGKAEVRLSPGSYMMQPGGNYSTRPPATRPRSACSSWKATERLTSSRWRVETHLRRSKGLRRVLSPIFLCPSSGRQTCVRETALRPSTQLRASRAASRDAADKEKSAPPTTKQRRRLAYPLRPPGAHGERHCPGAPVQQTKKAARQRQWTKRESRPPPRGPSLGRAP